jgi:hypothetical protein
MNNHTSPRNKRQEGLVAIFVVSIIVIILALITTGFTKIMNREFRQSIDRELATQAHYAAESGLNDARAYVSNAVKNNDIDSVDTNGQCLNLNELPSTDFIDSGSLSGNFNNDDSDQIIKYTCVIINTKIKELSYTIPAGQSKIFKVYTSTPLESMYFGWHNAGANPSTARGIDQVPGFPAHPLPREKDMQSAETGVLRASIYAVPSGLDSPTDSEAINKTLEDASRTYFMYPNDSNLNTPGSTSVKTTNGNFVDGNCKTSNFTTSPLPSKQTKHFCNTKVTDLGPDPSPPPPPVTPQTVTIKGYVEGGTSQPDIHMRIVASQGANRQTLLCGNNALGAPDCTAANKGGQYDPGSIGGPASRDSCVSWPAASLNEHKATFTRTFALTPGLFTNPDVTFAFTGDGASGTTQDNNIIVQQVQFGGNALGVPYQWNMSQINYNNLAGTSLGQPLNGKLCWEGRATWRSSAFLPPTPPVTGNAYYYVRLTALYHDLDVSFQTADSSDNPLKINDAQAIIDVTAEGNDVLKRLEGRASLQPDYPFPNYTVQSMDTICKRLRLPKIAPGSDPSSFGNAEIDDDPADTAFSTDLQNSCQPSS